MCGAQTGRDLRSHAASAAKETRLPRQLLVGGASSIVPYYTTLVNDQVPCSPQEQPCEQKERKPHGVYLLSLLTPHTYSTQFWFYPFLAAGTHLKYEDVVKPGEATAAAGRR